MVKISRRNFLQFTGLSSLSIFSGQKSFSKITEKIQDTKNKIIPQGHDPWIELDLEKMSWNLKQIRNRTKVPVMAVIKANGYGHGLVEVGQHLEKCGINSLMVGKLQEAFHLREAGVKAPIFNFGSFCEKEADQIIKNNISQSIYNEDFTFLNKAALNLAKIIKINIHVDTGMGRMGVPYLKALSFIQKVSSMKNLIIGGISTTLTEEDEFDREQINRLLVLSREAESKGISLGSKHAASSDGIMDLPQSYLDMVRPGIALYGYYPSDRTQEEDSLALKPVLQFKSKIVDVKTIRPGDTLTYHRKYKVKKRGKIAIIPVGYSDGYPPNAVGKASVLIKGKRYPLVAAITANHAIALLDRNSKITTGDEVVLIGSQGKEKITAVEIARWTGVSSYKILIGLNPMLPKNII